MRKLFLLVLISWLSVKTFSQTNLFPSSGNTSVGAGSSPGYKLHVVGDLAIDGDRLKFPTALGWSGSSSAQIWRDAAYGFVIRAATGQYYDFVLTDGSGDGIIIVPGGGQKQVVFGGDVGVPATGKLYLDGISGTYISQVSDDVINFVTGGYEKMRIDASGNVSIGVTNPLGYKLAVAGPMIADKVRVKLHNIWPDYVFNQQYNLLPLPELEKFIKNNNHLPGVLSATEVEKEGIDLGDNQAILLKKIEELTLYIIELDKRNVEQNKKIEELAKKVKN